MEKGVSPIQDLEILIMEALEAYGLSSKEAKLLSRETIVKARRIRSPRKARTALVTIEDDFANKGLIKIFMKADARGEPEAILANYVNDRKKYPAFEEWDVEKAIGGMSLTTRVFHCTLKPKETAPRKKKTPNFESISPEEAAFLIKKLQSMTNVEN